MPGWGRCDLRAQDRAGLLVCDRSEMERCAGAGCVASRGATGGATGTGSVARRGATGTGSVARRGATATGSVARRGATGCATATGDTATGCAAAPRRALAVDARGSATARPRS